MKYQFTLVLVLICKLLFAQVSNDNCDKPILISDPTNYCSKAGEFTNVGATPSGYGPANCFTNSSNDVWFSFVAQATDVTIVVKGLINVIGAGGTLASPQVALYQGICGGTISELECQSSTSGIAQLYQGGLIVGNTYFIRIQGKNNGVGTFQLCMINYNPPKEPTGDCPTASILCDKSPFVVKSVKGSGNDSKEAEGAPCFSGSNTLVEMNSTWYAWTCDKSGTLTFTLKPLKEDDDLDFIVYELPNGVENCNGKIVLRCMASGDFSFPSPCMGPTGLSLTSTDLSESIGCNKDLPKDAFVKALDMVSGKSYAVMINNFTSTGTGFSMEFGGTGTFLGPVPDFTITSIAGTSPICFGDDVSVLDKSTFKLGALTKWTWNFGLGAIPGTASGSGPIPVRYDSPGEKYVSLLVESDKGCQVTKILSFKIDPCCSTKNSIKLNNSTIVDLKCNNIHDGSISLNASSTIPILAYLWNSGQNSSTINNLDKNQYSVTIATEVCDTVFNYTVKGPPEITFDTILTKPTCNGGQDGKIEINTIGGVPPYKYKWFNGNTTNTVSNLPIGNYQLTVTDANLCQNFLSINLKELELELNPNVKVISPPTCFGYSDGKINVVIANGKPPFLYNFNDGKGFVNSNVLNNIAKGTYVVEALDANGCKGKFDLVVTEPDKISIDLDTINVSCYGLSDGNLSANVTGGVGGYIYLWNNGKATKSADKIPSGNYTLTVVDANGCEAKAIGTIIQPPQLFINPVHAYHLLCFGDSIGSLSVIGSGGTPSYQYSLDGKSFQNDTLFRNLKAGKYTITIKDSIGCLSNTYMTLNQPEKLIVDAGKDTTIELGFGTILVANYIPRDREVTYKWSPIEFITKCSDCKRTEVMPYNATYFKILLKDENGCVAIDSVLVNVEKKRSIYIPNAFSPNYDGWNDKFTAFSNQAAKSIQLMRVYNRWGGLVYETRNIPLNDDKFGWDGFFNGKELPPDVFTYYMEIEFVDGVILPYKGDITIIK